MVGATAFVVVYLINFFEMSFYLGFKELGHKV